MTTENFIPTVWAASLLENLNDAHVYASVFNSDYEGDIRDAGDTVRINSIGRITISNYTKNSNLSDPEALDDSFMMLTIDQAKSFNFQIDNIDRWQQKPKLMAAATKEAAWGLADVADVHLEAALIAGVAATAPDNTIGAKTVGTGSGDTNAYELLVDLAVLLEAQNVPDMGRWVIVPPWYHGMLKKDARFVDHGTSANRANLRGAPVGMAGTLSVKISNNISGGAAANVIAGYPGAATYAEQIKEVVAYQPEKRFGDALKGLHLYGSKVTRPYALATVAATEG